ncbi:hypothetical protein FQN60_016031, partial [Etheostoma spectabile]
METTRSQDDKGGADGQWLYRILHPPAIKDYNKNIGGVDLSDALIGYTRILAQQDKRYRFSCSTLLTLLCKSFILSQERAIAT